MAESLFMWRYLDDGIHCIPTSPDVYLTHQACVFRVFSLHPVSEKAYAGTANGKISPMAGELKDAMQWVERELKEPGSVPVLSAETPTI